MSRPELLALEDATSPHVHSLCTPPAPITPPVTPPITPPIRSYLSGVITTSSGCGTQLDHAVQATGYNAEGNYWIIRNSWGTGWGMEGFVHVEVRPLPAPAMHTLVLAQKP